MQIGGAMPYVAPSPSSLPARPGSPAIFPDLAPAAPASAAPARSLPAEEPAPTARPSDEATPQQRAQLERLTQLEIAELAGRDREVRAHEQAHAAVGGSYAGAPSYSFKRGPDGRAYAVGGEVSIDASPIPNDPAATLSKMAIVQRAALAPAEPSAQDLRVAAQAQAQALAAQARAELAAQRREQAAAASAERRERAEHRDSESAVEEDAPAPRQQALPPAPNLEVYRRLAEVQAPAPLVDLVA